MTDEPDIDIERTSDLVLIKKPECLTCTHLLGDLGHETYECHTAKNCPAQTYGIAIGVDILQVSTDLANAWAANDLGSVTKISNKLADIHPAVRSKVMAMAKTKMREAG